MRGVMQRVALKRFARERGGNVAMMWAMMGSVLVGLIGVTVDFTRAQALRAQMQNAADGAALVAERSSNLSMADRTAAARAFFDAEMGALAPTATVRVTQLHDGGHRVEANMPMPLSLARIVRGEDWNIGVRSEAQADASPPIEVALVLDNTGSMRNDMGALRNAAESLVTDLLRLDGDSVHISLVPFVAQVNIGNRPEHMAWMDTAGTAPYNGELLEDRSIAFRNRTTTGANRTGSNCELISTMPYTNYPGPYRINWVRSGSRCYAFTPEGINYFTLYDLIPNVAWGGCVEARPEPYDISDDAPNPLNPATMFVPFFWLDTTDGYSNSYLTDTIGDITSATMSSSSGGSSTAQNQREARMFNVFKYRNQSASVTTNPPEARGPNRGCPTPLVPLTNDEVIIVAYCQLPAEEARNYNPNVVLLGEGNRVIG